MTTKLLPKPTEATATARYPIIELVIAWIDFQSTLDGGRLTLDEAAVVASFVLSSKNREITSLRRFPVHPFCALRILACTQQLRLQVSCPYFTLPIAYLSSGKK